MTILLLILITLLSLTVIFYHLKNQQLQQNIQINRQKITNNKTLLQKVLIDQELERQTIGTTLQSNLSSKLYTVQYALHQLKKGKETPITNQAIDSILEITQSSLTLINQLTSSIISSSLYELGVIPALHELSKEYKASIQIQIMPDEQNQPASLHTQLYYTIKEWFDQSIHHQATEIQVIWQFQENNWQLTYQDNGKYLSQVHKNNYLVAVRLSIVQAHIKYCHTSSKGIKLKVKNSN